MRKLLSKIGGHVAKAPKCQNAAERSGIALADAIAGHPGADPIEMQVLSQRGFVCAGGDVARGPRSSATLADFRVVRPSTRSKS